MAWTINEEKRPLWIARAYAMVLLITGLIALILVLRSAVGINDVAINIASIERTSENIASVHFFAFGLLFASLLTIAMFFYATTALFLASGLWRLREWARHGILVLALAAAPVFLFMPLIKAVLLKANAPPASMMGIDTFIGAPLVIALLAGVVVTVYLFAYRNEIIALYTPRPNLVRKGRRYSYAPTPLPRKNSNKGDEGVF